MQDAGRILLMPKGDYSASATYEMLDLVNHSGASWVCKKDCTGQEPSDSNTEFWQRFGTAVDLSNYFPKSGGTLSAPGTTVLSIKNTRDGELRAFVKFEGAEEMGRLGFNGVDVPVVYSSTLGTRPLLHTGNMADHVLPLSGGTVASNNDVPFSMKSKTSKAVYQRFINSEGREIYFGFDENGEAKAIGKGIFLHTGNKPTGTYTGNGDATKRTINIGSSMPRSIIVTSSNGMVLMTYYGAIYKETSGTTVSGLSWGECALLDTGNIQLITTNPMLNASGVVYTYYSV